MSRPRAAALLPTLVLPGVLLAATGPAPTGRTYFIYVVGLNDEPYLAAADCLTFSATQACTLDGDTCLDWWRTGGGQQTNKQFGFGLAAAIDEPLRGGSGG